MKTKMFNSLSLKSRKVAENFVNIRGKFMKTDFEGYVKVIKLLIFMLRCD